MTLYFIPHVLYFTDFICDVSRKTGIILDATYTGKAALGLVKELKENPQRFNGNKILFIHTGELTLTTLKYFCKTIEIKGFSTAIRNISILSLQGQSLYVRI